MALPRTPLTKRSKLMSGQSSQLPQHRLLPSLLLRSTGTKVGTLGELKEALGVVKTLMTREKRTHDVFMSGVATALCAEFIEVLKYIDGAVPYEEPCYGHLGRRSDP